MHKINPVFIPASHSQNFFQSYGFWSLACTWMRKGRAGSCVGLLDQAEMGGVLSVHVLCSSKIIQFLALPQLLRCSVSCFFSWGHGAMPKQQNPCYRTTELSSTERPSSASPNTNPACHTSKLCPQCHSHISAVPPGMGTPPHP